MITMGIGVMGLLSEGASRCEPNQECCQPRCAHNGGSRCQPSVLERTAHDPINGGTRASGTTSWKTQHRTHAARWVDTTPH